MPGYYTNFYAVVFIPSDTNNYSSVTSMVRCVVLVPGPARLKIAQDSVTLVEGIGPYLLEESSDLKAWHEVQALSVGESYCIPTGRVKGFFRAVRSVLGNPVAKSQ